MTKAQQKQFYSVLGQYTCNEFNEYPAILGDLQRALKEKPDELADYVGDITMWEKVEFSFTVRDFCEQLGLTEDTDLTPPVDKPKKKSSMDFQKTRNKMADKLNAFILEYKEFTKQVSPKNWRTTGTHCTQLDNICMEIQDFKGITAEEKEIDWVKKELEK